MWHGSHKNKISGKELFLAIWLYRKDSTRPEWHFENDSGFNIVQLSTVNAYVRHFNGLVVCKTKIYLQNITLP